MPARDARFREFVFPFGVAVQVLRVTDRAKVEDDCNAAIPEHWEVQRGSLGDRLTG